MVVLFFICCFEIFVKVVRFNQEIHTVSTFDILRDRNCT